MELALGLDRFHVLEFGQRGCGGTRANALVRGVFNLVALLVSALQNNDFVHEQTSFCRLLRLLVALHRKLLHLCAGDVVLLAQNLGALELRKPPAPASSESLSVLALKLRAEGQT